MAIGTVRFRRVPAPASTAWRLPWSKRAPAEITFHTFGEELVADLVRACGRAGWRAEDHGEWPVSDVRWDPDFRVNLEIAGVKGRIYLLPPYRIDDEGEALIEDILNDALRADIEVVVRRALSSRPDVALIDAGEDRDR